MLRGIILAQAVSGGTLLVHVAGTDSFRLSELCTHCARHVPDSSELSQARQERSRSAELS